MPQNPNFPPWGAYSALQTQSAPDVAHVCHVFRPTRICFRSTFVYYVYTADLEDVISEHGVNMHAYADDSQLYLHCRYDDVTITVCRLEQCITEVGLWMSANRLKLNADKTELLWAGSNTAKLY